MKIAIVLNTSWNIFNFRLNFIKSLLRQGYEVHTIAPHDGYTKFLVEAGCIHHDVKMDSRGVNPIKDAALLIELWSIYRKIKPDTILHYTIKPNIYGTLAASFLKIPTINNVCGLGTVFLRKGVAYAIAKMLYKVAFRFPKRVFFQNRDDLNLFLDKKLVSEKVADLVPGSGIDLTRFQPTEFKRNTTFTFLLISRLITDKGVLEYIEAVNKLRLKGVNAKFQILGAKDPLHKRGIPVSVIESWIKAGTVEYLGTTDDVRQFINAADCVVLPSYREGTPRTLLEAAGSAKPIVASDVPGCHHVVQDQFNGLLCEMKNADDLAKKMEQMAGFTDSQLKQLGTNGRKKIEREFDEKIVIERYMSAINSL